MERSKLTTLCYMEREGEWLMLHRVSKKNDVNKDKWIGIGGHFEENESPEECLLREVKEETGLTLTSWRFRGLVTFRSTGGPVEDMAVYGLNIWEGDKIFFRLLNENAPFFSLKLTYEGDRLIEAVLDGKALIA